MILTSIRSAHKFDTGAGVCEVVPTARMLETSGVLVLVTTGKILAAVVSVFVSTGIRFRVSGTEIDVDDAGTSVLTPNSFRDPLDTCAGVLVLVTPDAFIFEGSGSLMGVDSVAALFFTASAIASTFPHGPGVLILAGLGITVEGSGTVIVVAVALTDAVWVFIFI